MDKKPIQKTVLIIFLAVCIALFAELFFLLIENKLRLEQLLNPSFEWFILIRLKRMLVVAIFTAAVLLTLISKKHREIFEFFYQKRFFVAVGLLIVCVIFQLSGSSILYWQYYFDDSKVYDALIGVARGVRADEWAVNTPMALSQYLNASGSFPYFSETIRGALTDVFLVYGQPVKNLAVIFRPFHWGYLFLDPARGLSFFWAGRLIALFMVSFETGMMISKNSKKLSLIYGALIAWAPIVQWWFAVNGLVEMLIFGQLAILMVKKYIETKQFRLKILFAIIFFISAGAYLFTFYPSWQISLAYILLFFFISILVENRAIIHLQLKDWLLLSGLLIVFVMGVTLILFKSYETIELVMGTVYPGSRFETGGGQIYRYFLYPGNLFFATSRALPYGNSSELSMFFDFFPMGMLLSFWVLFKEKQKDIFLSLFLVLLLVLSSYCIFNWPGMLAKITLLSNIQPYRVSLAVGFINILLLIRSLALLKTEISCKMAAGTAASMALFMAIGAMIIYNGYINILMFVVIFFVLVIGFFAILRFKKALSQKLLMGTVMFVVFVAGMFVNPLTQGLDVIYEREIIGLISQVNMDENGLWVVESEAGGGYPIINLPIMAGAATINSTNVYPDLDRWRLLDPEGDYNEVYNRYAHISVHLCEPQEYTDKFILDSADLFTVNLTLADLKTLNVSYILTKRDLNGLTQDQVTLNLLGTENGFNLYKINQ
ncbi:hypothetical protein Q5O14_01530 [Eubacteriaceae bacterium ES2]|nr:hypothetical protein Q5O14_01530 [Eubacteriaceae bacterium ES2]